MPHFSKRGSDRRPASRPAAGEPVASGPRSGSARDEVKLCGLAAVRARFARDPGSIQRLFFDRATGQRVGAICQALAVAKKIYRQVEPAELAKVSGTLHHGGIVAVVTPPVLRAPSPAEVRAWAAQGAPVLLLERVGNPHNLGAIARTAGFLGVARIVLPNHPDAALPGGAAFRVAEGGLEAVEVFRVESLVAFARSLAAAGYDVVGAATRGGRVDLARVPGKPVALVVGNEERGLSSEMAAACTRLVTIPGGGGVESLNVSVAAAVLMWELCARRK
ncbi:MAG: RNA methyltransferase [Opitutus sp.]|nr:RNA methyltransferase [Opitutus sp.]